MDDGGVEIHVSESHHDEVALSYSFDWRTFLPFSTFGKVNPDELALYVQNQRNMFAAGAGWDVRDTAGVTSEPEEETVPITKEAVVAAQNAATEVSFKEVCATIDAGIIKEYQPTNLYGFTVAIELKDQTLRRRVLEAYKQAGWEVEYEGPSQRGDNAFLRFK